MLLLLVVSVHAKPIVGQEFVVHGLYEHPLSVELPRERVHDTPRALAAPRLLHRILRDADELSDARRSVVAPGPVRHRPSLAEPISRGVPTERRR